MCYGYGLRENELNSASPQFVALFLQGNIERESAQIKTSWAQARFIASTMSKEAGKYKFPWERFQVARPEIDPKVWENFKLTTDGVEANVSEVKKILGI